MLLIIVLTKETAIKQTIIKLEEDVSEETIFFEGSKTLPHPQHSNNIATAKSNAISFFMMDFLPKNENKIYLCNKNYIQQFMDGMKYLRHRSCYPQ